jgi:hypothetical protein
MGVPADGVDIQVTLRGSTPVEVELLGIDGPPALGPEIEAIRSRLPNWVSLHSNSYRQTLLKI